MLLLPNEFLTEVTVNAVQLVLNLENVFKGNWKWSELTLNSDRHYLMKQCSVQDILQNN